ncbi:MAG: hypothetical protein AB7P94_11115 [Steroidobacteraceae bacterium]
MARERPRHAMQRGRHAAARGMNENVLDQWLADESRNGASAVTAQVDAIISGAIRA